jgi:hypothetical protein
LVCKWTEEEYEIVLDCLKSGMTYSDASKILLENGFRRTGVAIKSFLTKKGLCRTNIIQGNEVLFNFPQTLTSEQRKYAKLYLETNSEQKVAETFDIDLATLREELWLAYKKGVNLSPYRFTPVAPVGFDLKKSTIQHNQDGEIQRWDRVAPNCETFDDTWKPTAPDGYQIKKATIQVNGDGKIIQQWNQMRPEEEMVLDFAEFCEQRIPQSESDLVAPTNVREEYLLEIPIFDIHHGMLAWAKETGANYDHKISRHLQVASAKILFDHFGAVNTVVVYLGGDNQHVDNMSSKTTKNENHLDTDSRYARIAWCTYETNVTMIEEAKKIAKNIVVFVLSGNHDNVSAVHLSIQLHAYFRDDPQVDIKVDPEIHKFFQWKTNAFCITHGNTNDKRIATYALQQVIRRNMQNVERVMVRMGHLHKRLRTPPYGLTEEDGVVIERFPTIAAQEAYSVEAAYTSLRATSAILWHDAWGRYGGREVSLGEILKKYPYNKQRSN